MGVRDGQKKRFVTRRACQVVEALSALVFDLVVVVDLHAANAGTSFQYRAHTHAGWPEAGAFEPVGRPGKVGRVNVGGQAFVKAMQLICPNEMHLAAQNCAVTRLTQVVRHGGRGRCEFGCIVISTQGMRQAPAQHGHARRRANREIAIGAVKHHAALGQRAQVRRLDHRVPVKGQSLHSQLVCHDQQNIGLRLIHWINV